MQSVAIGNGSTNTAGELMANGEDHSDNTGVNIDASGETSTNRGANINTSGNSATNTAINLNVTGDASTNVGINGNVQGTSDNNVGMLMSASGSTVRNQGIQSNAIGSSPHNVAISGFSGGGTISNRGVEANATGDGVDNMAVRAYSEGSNGSYNHGVEAAALGNNNNLNIGLITWVKGDNNNVFLTNNSLSTNKYNTGYYSNVSGNNSVNVAMTGIIGGMAFNNSNVNSDCYGVIGSVTIGEGNLHVGVKGEVLNYLGATVNYGVWGVQPVGTASPSSSPTSGSNGTSPVAYAGYFDGDVFCSNTYYYSDPKLKQNVKEYAGALSQLRKLNIKSYTFKNDVYPDMNLPQGDQVGVLSTELKTVFPNLVKHSMHVSPESKDNKYVEFDAVNYNALIPVLIQAVKELDVKTNENKQLEEKVANLENKLAQLSALESKLTQLENNLNEICDKGCEGMKTGTAKSNVEPSMLFQNVPNPLDKNTRIDYIIGSEAQTASILIYTADGTIINKFEQLTTGKGSITVNAETLTAGTYYYTLFCNNKKVDTKTMVIVSK